MKKQVRDKEDKPSSSKIYQKGTPEVENKQSGEEATENIFIFKIFTKHKTQKIQKVQSLIQPINSSPWSQLGSQFPYVYVQRDFIHTKIITWNGRTIEIYTHSAICFYWGIIYMQKTHPL